MSNRCVDAFIETSAKAGYNVKQVRRRVRRRVYRDQHESRSNRCVDAFIETSAKAGYNVKQVRRRVYRDQRESRLQCQTGA